MEKEINVSMFIKCENPNQRILKLINTANAPDLEGAFIKLKYDDNLCGIYYIAITSGYLNKEEGLFIEIKHNYCSEKYETLPDEIHGFNYIDFTKNKWKLESKS